MAQKYVIQLLTATTAEWNASQYVIPAGELVAEYLVDDTIQLKIGNGLHKFSDLPYLADKGPKGEPFTYADFTTEQLATLKGEKGDPFEYEDFTPQQLASLKGETGQGFVVKGTYGSLELLEAAITSPEVGDAYGVGAVAPYDIYIYDGINLTWVNYGQLQGAKGDKGDAFTYADFTTAQLAALKGANGVSPTITTSKTGKITTLTITDADGTETVTINDGADVVVDAEISDTSENAVQNKVIKAYIDGLIGDIDAAMEEINGVVGGA